MVQQNPTYAFENKEYKKEWMEWVPGFEGKVRYKDGTFSINADGSRTVYDGATNYMGTVNADGTFTPNAGTGDGEYEMTFLRAAAEVEV